VWFEHVITHGMQRIRAHLELSGEELHVHANSEARFERVLATIRALDPSVTVLRETREPAGDVRVVQRLAARSSATPATFLDPAADPAIAAALEEMARTYEAAWLDEPIPALAGHTPRECADDLTRRPARSYRPDLVGRLARPGSSRSVPVPSHCRQSSTLIPMQSSAGQPAVALRGTHMAASRS
jgi:hypothetical protein